MTDFGRRPPVAAPNVLPKTGQLISFYDRDDGYYQAGWAGERFSDNGDGTITDNATNIVWPADFTGDGGDNGALLNWEDAMAWVNALSFAGRDDWKIPNLFEFASLYDSALDHPAIPAVFTVEEDAYYWTSTTRPNLTTEASYAFTRDQHFDHVAKGFPVRVVCCRVA